MIAKILELLTGKDDVERVAYREDLRALNEYLKERKLFFPKKPIRFLDAGNFTQEDLLTLIEEESKALSSERLDLWILDVDGKKRLPAFSSRKKMEAFSRKMSMRLNKVFSLGCVDLLIHDVAKQLNIDFVDLNVFSEKSWEISINKPS